MNGARPYCPSTGDAIEFRTPQHSPLPVTISHSFVHIDPNWSLSVCHPQKLWTNPANFRAFKVLIAAEYNSVEIEVPEFDHSSSSKSPEFLSKSPLGRVPVLETPQVRRQSGL